MAALFVRLAREPQIMHPPSADVACLPSVGGIPEQFAGPAARFHSYIQAFRAC
jgi:hypothetical protein